MYRSKNTAVKNTFCVELYDEKADKTIILSVYPPKMSVIQKINRLSKDVSDPEILDEMIAILADAISSNKEKADLSSERLSELLDMEDVVSLFEDLFGWVGELKKK